MTHDAIVIGAGPGGLAAAAMLQRAGERPVVLDRASRVANTWRNYYDRLELQSPRWLTSLPGCHFHREAGRWPTRDAVVDYLEEYVRAYDIDVRLGTEVRRITRHAGGWEAETTRGPIRARRVVVATGYNHEPAIPEWRGVDSFRGKLLHADEFRSGGRFRGRDVLVVGGGNSGSEIAAILADEGARRVWLSIRTPPHVAPREAFGLPSLLSVVVTRRLPARVVDKILAALIRITVGDPRSFRLQRPPTGLRTQYEQTAVTPILDHGIVDHLRSGRVTPVAAVEAFDGADVVLADGQRVAPAMVIAATGYRRGLEPLVGHLGVLAPDGRPAVHGVRTHPAAPALHFIGFTHPLSGNIREMAIDARRIGRAAARERARVAGLLRWVAAAVADAVRPPRSRRPVLRRVPPLAGDRPRRAPATVLEKQGRRAPYAQAAADQRES